MKTTLKLLISGLTLLTLATLNFQLSTAFAQGTAFTYQGRLNSGGSPASGTYNLTFALFNTNTSGVAIAGPVTNNAVVITNGLFTVTIDFGPGGFTGSSNWLQIGVATNGASTFTTLAPRQQITPAPYAIMAENASNLLGTLPAGQLSGTYSSPVAFTNGGNSFSGAFNGDGSRLMNVPGAVAWQAAGTSQQAVSDIGYLATNNTQPTVITLPTAPNVGDVIRVSGIGAGGWEILPNAGQTILAGNFQFSQSSGTLWTPTYSGSGGFTAVTISSDGRNIAALNGYRTIFSGDSGITWTANSASGGNIAMAASSDGTKLVSVGNGIYTSPDGGKTWTLSTNLSGCTSVASSADGNTLYVTRNGGPYPLYYSVNGGATWMTNNMGFHNWSHICCSADGTHVVAIGDGHLYYSTYQGNTCTNNSSLSAFAGLVIFPDGSRIINFSGGTLYFFQNGVSTYTEHLITGGSANAIALSSDGSRIVAAGGAGIYMSKDFGVTWTTTSAPGSSWSYVASSADGSRWVATTGSQIYIAQLATTASTGYLVGTQGATVELQYLGNNYFLPLSSQGLISAY